MISAHKEPLTIEVGSELPQSPHQPEHLPSCHAVATFWLGQRAARVSHNPFFTAILLTQNSTKSISASIHVD
ncbi:hypothetical protein T01_14443 [Trichinella spiralis]|uniref:Uncharacterized protein n=1 Tax=Trichinella spiralis TaxID=6334 RepID=A0A0V1BHL4_TRISP|nr:hypothetical protein T01_14443 [Trichinella spiralis]